MTMITIALSAENPGKALAEAARIIGEGGIVAFPTETFYGLGVRYDSREALRRLYDIKHRPEEKAMPLIIGSRKMMTSVALSPGRIAERLMDRFWPGPLTLLVPARDELSEFITAGTGRVAVRMPGESFGLRLAMALPFPITATSANISGSPPADNARDVVRYFGDSLDLIIDGGRTPGGKPSTIADVSGDGLNIVREGIIPAEEIRGYIQKSGFQ